MSSSSSFGGVSCAATDDLSASMRSSPVSPVSPLDVSVGKAVAFSPVPPETKEFCPDEVLTSLSPQPEQAEDALSVIPFVDIPAEFTSSDKFSTMVWMINYCITLLNASVLQPEQIARALRDFIRLQDQTNPSRTCGIFLKRLLSSFQRIGFKNFDVKHASNLVTLLAIGFSEPEATDIIKFLAGCTLKPLSSSKLTPRDRLWYFWLLVNLKIQTNLLDDRDNLKWFYAYSTNPKNPLNLLPEGWDMESLTGQVTHIYNRFEAIRENGLSKRSDRQQARINDEGSDAGSEFSTATHASNGYLLKYWAAFNALSKLLNEWLSGNTLLREGKGELLEDKLIELVYRFLKKMQCSKSGKFGNERAYSVHIYNTLMTTMWRCTKNGQKFIPRNQETFSAILCATGNYEAAIEWLSKAVECTHAKKGNLTPQETALIQYAFVAMSLGVQSLALCTAANLGALFAHIFDGVELQVNSSEYAIFQSAIDRVANDFQKEPIMEPTKEVQQPQIVSAQTGSQTKPQTSTPPTRGRGGRGGAAARSSTEHHASVDARDKEIEQMIQQLKLNPDKMAAMQKWLNES